MGSSIILFDQCAARHIYTECNYIGNTWKHTPKVHAYVGSHHGLCAVFRLHGTCTPILCNIRYVRVANLSEYTFTKLLCYNRWRCSRRRKEKQIIYIRTNERLREENHESHSIYSFIQAVCIAAVRIKCYQVEKLHYYYTQCELLYITFLHSLLCLLSAAVSFIRSFVGCHLVLQLLYCPRNCGTTLRHKR